MSFDVITTADFKAATSNTISTNELVFSIMHMLHQPFLVQNVAELLAEVNSK